MNYFKMNKKEIKALCKKHKIKGITGKRKDELIEMITQRDAMQVLGVYHSVTFETNI